MSLENLANLIWTSGMNLPDIAFIREEEICTQESKIEKKENYFGPENSSHLNFINL